MNKKRFIILLFILFGLSTIVFSPSFFHVAKADHLPYLIETADLDNLKDLIIYSYSYPRVRTLLSGDRTLFRPIFYNVLALQKHFFGYNFIFWQITGLFLHLIVIGLLFRILYLIKSSQTIAFLTTLFFSLLYISADMVIWHHINPYMLCFIFVLLSQKYAIRYLQDSSSGSKNICYMLFFLTLACLTNELGIIACGCFLVMLLIFKKEKSYLKSPAQWLILPIVIYAYLSLLDYWLRFSHLPFLATDNTVSWTALISTLPWQFLSVLLSALLLPLCPSLFLIHPDERNYATFYYGNGFVEYLIHHKGMVFLNVVLLLFIVGYLTFLFNKRKEMFSTLRQTCKSKPAKIRLFMCLLNLFLACGYIFIFIAFRTSTKSMTYLSSSLYQFYPLCLFLFIAIYSLGSLFTSDDSPSKGAGKNILMLILCLGILLNAVRLYSLNQQGKALFAPWRQYMAQLTTFVNTHKHEPNFSIAFKDREHLRPMRIRMGEGKEAKDIYGNLSDYLFRQYIDNTNPKYSLSYQNGILQNN